MSQSLLASWKSKKDRSHSFLKDSEWKLIQTGKGVSLLASLHTQKNAKGILILLHGWEGSIGSSYIVRTGEFFYRQGYSIYRLNLRDHGDTHHLNEGLFNGSLLEETYEGVLKLASLNSSKLPVYLAGFSLGGNFVIRIAQKHSLSKRTEQIPLLKHSFAVSPALDPMAATIKMDKHSLLRKYFLKSWIRSLKKKESLFPYLYRFGGLSEFKTVMDLTKEMVLKHSEFKTVEEYFLTYTLQKDFFKKIKTPITILTSEDDPVIPVRDFNEIPSNPYVETIVESRGGHCGFIEDTSRNAFYWKIMKLKMR
ncbi:YheT family hydrolase [Leptospira idonii]|nr:alpha/beta fold hydrolase [Leptospira idonii]